MKRILNKYIIIILSFYAFWILVLPICFSKLVPLLCEHLSKNSDYNIEIIKPRLYLSPIPKATIRVQKFLFETKNNNDNILIENFSTNIRLLPLLSGRVHINDIAVSNVSIKTLLRDDLELDKDFFVKLTKTKLSIDKIKVDNVLSKIERQNLKDSVLYEAKNLYFVDNSKLLKFHIDSVLSMKGTSSKANFNLVLPKDNDVNNSEVDLIIENIDIEPIGEYFKQYLPKDFVSLKGVINVEANKQNLDCVLKNIAINMKEDAKSIRFPRVLRINSEFDITSKLINFRHVDIKAKNIDAYVTGSIKDYMKFSSTLVDFNISLNKSRVEDIVEMLPPFIVEDINAYKLKFYKFYGDVIGNLSIKGDLIEPDINGAVIVSNGILTKPIKNAKGATVKLNFLGKYLEFDADVPAGGKEKVWVKGGVELYNIKYSNMKIWSTKNVDLETAEDKVVPIHEILNFLIGPVPIMNIKGQGNIDMTVKGNRQDPHIWGGLNFYNVKTFFNEIPNMVLKDADATLMFDDQKVHFDTKKGFVNDKSINITGDCDLSGKFDFDVSSNSQEIGYLLNAINTSTMLEDVKKILPKLDVSKGLVNLNLKVFGQVINFEDIKFNENVFSKGEIELLGNTFGVQGINIHNTKGKIHFDKMDANAEIDAYLGSSKLSALAKIKDSIADLNLKIPSLNVADILPAISNDLKTDIGNIFLDVALGYKGKFDDIEYNKIHFVSKVLGVTPTNKLKLKNGQIILKDGNLKVENISGTVLNSASNYKIDICADNIFETPKTNGVIQLKAFDLTLLNQISKYNIVPQNIKDLVFEKGKINLNCRIKDNKLNAYTDLGGLKLSYKPLALPIDIINGSLIIKNNNLRINKLNILADGMPILIDGDVDDIIHKQFFNIYINSKPKQDFIEKYINKNQIYPVKFKGDIVYYLRLKGVKDNFNILSEVNLAKDASIYHLGATVGDIENAIVLNFDARIIKQNIVKIKEFSYDKIIASLGHKHTRLNMLKAKGGIEVYKDDLVFNDLLIKTENPTDARIFNIIFRKPNIKQGQFTSNLKFNGRLSNPRILGDFHIFETNIPFLDTTMKNVALKFKDKDIELSSKGEILGNDIAFNGVMQNKLTLPYYIEKANLYTQFLDLNYIIDKLKISEVENYSTFASLEGFDLGSIVIKDMNLNADNIYLRNIVAKDFVANVSLNERKIFNVNNFKFNIASGILGGTFSYNLANNYTGLKIKAKDIDANDLTYALFDLENQMYGDLTGDIKLSCVGESFDNCMKTLNGRTVFNVINGRLPKLGSLEYLLKAGNLVKGGITGVSINSIVDLVTPLKTGDFSSIYGEIDIKEGIADNIAITTRGKDLSLFISGNYNFSNANAEMEVVGLLSKKISTMFGPIGNFSLNSMFNAIPGVDLSKNTKILEHINRIPGIELSSKAFRKFIAEIKGNINGEDYVASFKWVN